MLMCSVLSCAIFNPLALCTEALAFGAVPQLGDEALQAPHLATMAAGALCTFLNLSFEIKGYQMAKPGKAAMFVYLEVPFGYFLQCLREQRPVRLSAFVGSCLIIVSALLGAFVQLAPPEGYCTACEVC